MRERAACTASVVALFFLVREVLSALLFYGQPLSQAGKIS